MRHFRSLTRHLAEQCPPICENAIPIPCVFLCVETVYLTKGCFEMQNLFGWSYLYTVGSSDALQTGLITPSSSRMSQSSTMVPRIIFIVSIYLSNRCIFAHLSPVSHADSSLVGRCTDQGRNIECRLREACCHHLDLRTGTRCHPPSSSGAPPSCRR